MERVKYWLPWGEEFYGVTEREHVRLCQDPCFLKAAIMLDGVTAVTSSKATLVHLIVSVCVCGGVLNVSSRS